MTANNQEIQAAFYFQRNLITPTRFEMSKSLYTGCSDQIMSIWLTFLETSHMESIVKWSICSHCCNYTHLRSWLFFHLINVAVLSHKIRLQVLLQWKGLLYSNITKLSKHFVFQLCDFFMFSLICMLIELAFTHLSLGSPQLGGSNLFSWKKTETWNRYKPVGYPKEKCVLK